MVSHLSVRLSVALPVIKMPNPTISKLKAPAVDIHGACVGVAAEIKKSVDLIKMMNGKRNHSKVSCPRTEISFVFMSSSIPRAAYSGVSTTVALAHRRPQSAVDVLHICVGCPGQRRRWDGSIHTVP